MPKGFGFVHHSRTICCRAVPNPHLTIRDFFTAVAPGRLRRALRRHQVIGDVLRRGVEAAQSGEVAEGEVRDGVQLVHEAAVHALCVCVCVQFLRVSRLRETAGRRAAWRWHCKYLHVAAVSHGDIRRCARVQLVPTQPVAAVQSVAPLPTTSGRDRTPPSQCRILRSLQSSPRGPQAPLEKGLQR